MFLSWNSHFGQRVQKPAAAAWVAAEAQVRSSAGCGGLKDPVLLQWLIQSLAWELPCATDVAKKKGKKAEDILDAKANQLSLIYY